MIGLIEQVGTFTPEMRRLRLALRQSFVTVLRIRLVHSLSM